MLLHGPSRLSWRSSAEWVDGAAVEPGTTTAQPAGFLPNTPKAAPATTSGATHATPRELDAAEAGVLCTGSRGEAVYDTHNEQKLHQHLQLDEAAGSSSEDESDSVLLQQLEALELKWQVCSEMDGVDARFQAGTLRLIKADPAWSSSPAHLQQKCDHDHVQKVPWLQPRVGAVSRSTLGSTAAAGTSCLSKGSLTAGPRARQLLQALLQQPYLYIRGRDCPGGLMQHITITSSSSSSHSPNPGGRSHPGNQAGAFLSEAPTKVLLRNGPCSSA
eukprot:gene7921-8117_t